MVEQCPRTYGEILRKFTGPERGPVTDRPTGARQQLGPVIGTGYEALLCTVV